MLQPGEVARSEKRVICLGCAFWDTIFRVDHIPSTGGKILPGTAVQVASGMASAAAVTIARFGGAVSLWTRVGDDPTGRAFIADMASEGVAVGGIRQVPGARTWFSTILVDHRGERLVVPFIDPALDPDPSWLPLGDLAGAAAVLCDMRWMEGARIALREARRAGVPTILDADVAPVADLRELMTMADHVLFSEPALRSLVDVASPADALRAIAAAVDAEVIGVTLGERGAVIWHRDWRSTRDFATLPVKPVDTLNAGDIWHGAYAHGLAQGWDLHHIIRVASAAAAMKCEHFGGRLGAPRLPEVLARMSMRGAEGS